MNTPDNCDCHGIKMINIHYKKKLPSKLAELLPYNHYSRKMLGYFKDFSLGVWEVVDTDDDNLSKENWNFTSSKGIFDILSNNLGFINIYSIYKDKKVCPRGLSLNLI